MKEFSKEYDKSLPEDPCYPVLSYASCAIYAKYENEAKKYKNLYLLGRLAGFRYVNT